MASQDSDAASTELSAPDKARLLTIARRSIASHLAGEAYRPEQGVAPALERPKAVFVTLRTGGELRGCMGSLTPRESLWLEVQRTAALAATADPRFAPVTADELPDMAIEISVLGPLERVTDVSQIEIGVHGLFLLHGMRRGTLLPQVASDRGWSRDEFLLQLCRKAGLPDSAWRSGELYRFTADSFGDRGGAESR